MVQDPILSYRSVYHCKATDHERPNLGASIALLGENRLVSSEAARTLYGENVSVVASTTFIYEPGFLFLTRHVCLEEIV